MPANKVSTIISKEDFAAVNSAISTMKSKLPFLISLTKDEKSALPKFGDKSLAFVKKAYEIASQNQDFLPRNLNVEEMGKDVALYDQLFSISRSLQDLMEKLDDTFKEVGAEAYTAALIVYNSAKVSGKDVGGMENVMDELGKRFAKRSASKNDKP